MFKFITIIFVVIMFGGFVLVKILETKKKKLNSFDIRRYKVIELIKYFYPDLFIQFLEIQKTKNKKNEHLFILKLEEYLKNNLPIYYKELENEFIKYFFD
jgi:hypothetical protein